MFRIHIQLFCLWFWFLALCWITELSVGENCSFCWKQEIFSGKFEWRRFSLGGHRPCLSSHRAGCGATDLCPHYRACQQLWLVTGRTSSFNSSPRVPASYCYPMHNSGRQYWALIGRHQTTMGGPRESRSRSTEIKILFSYFIKTKCLIASFIK